eukprot:jgi/Mesvir1/9068/Mv21345-RA.1
MLAIMSAVASRGTVPPHGETPRHYSAQPPAGPHGAAGADRQRVKPLATRAGVENAPRDVRGRHAPQRMMDVFLDTVLPERARSGANAHVSDAYNGFQGVGWAHLQTFSRTPPGKREALIDSLSAHPAPQGDADLPQLQIGRTQRNHAAREPEDGRNRFASAEFGNPRGLRAPNRPTRTWCARTCVPR